MTFLERPNRFFVLTLFFILIGFGYLQTVNILDPDFGWHLKTGELILERGVPKVDWYSYTMPDFPWVDHEWLTDVLIYKLHSVFGYQSLLLLFLSLTALAFIIFIKIEHFYIYLVPVLFGFLSVLSYLGLRPQIITAFFVAISWKVLIDFLKKDNKGFHLFYLTPILFLIWVNLHGGFAAGIFVLSLVLALEIFKRTIVFERMMGLRFFQGQYSEKISTQKTILLFWILVLSFLATLINPYGIRIYEEVFRTVGDNFLRFHIAEWLPLFGTGASALTIFYLALTVGLLAVLRKKIEPNKTVLLTVFLVLSFLSQRHFLIFVILSIPVLSEMILILKEEIKPERVKMLFSGFGRLAVTFFIFALLFSGFFQNTKRLLKRENQIDYPSDSAIAFLRSLPLSENLFNDYGWGGYLIWKLPERKLFIDGRMPSWRQNGQFTFGDYIKITDAEDGFQGLLDKYNTKIIMLQSAEKNKEPKKEALIENWLSRIMGYNSPGNLYEELIGSDWENVYDDGIAVILRRSKH